LEWNGVNFTLMDTGGLSPHSKETMAAVVSEQVVLALDEADLVIFLCDAASGLTSVDLEVADILRRRGCPCLLVVNKMDHPDQTRSVAEFFRLGLGDPIPVSAATGRYSGDLLDHVVAGFSDLDLDDSTPDTQIRVVIAGRPNVGKSTLINRLCGRRVSIVDDQPGTTRDTTDTRIRWRDREYLLMDTAGLRRRSRVVDQVEYFSSLRAADTIGQADVVVVLLDAQEGGTVQDARIMSKVIDEGKGLVVAVNKWDLMAGEARQDEFSDNLRRRLPFLLHYPIVFLSALTGKKALQCLGSAARVFDRCQTRVSTSQLNRCVETWRGRFPPSGGKDIRLLYATQHATGPPTFAIFANRPDLISASYKRFVENNLRREFDFEGTPLRIHWRRRTATSPSRARTGVEA
jgi:GTP-binding protein